ncbi:sporulation protein YqfD [Desulfofundulus salinus]|uniref:Sporulation protein YqfD n=1 Tax=Desulfofundulus salinus TaxID=2419843 RepID=A0A494WSG3_9FIRM|nr:sporulation protein YqfD [Desulfofundulus salinum]RKO66236.1 sporulation protein YqfD [Desulfofundulus salinum]
MFLFRLMNFIIGYVTITIRGEVPEKFINMAAARGIFLWDITRLGEQTMRANVRLNAVRPLRHIARRTRCRFHITWRVGLPFLWMRLARRKALAFGAVLFVLGLYLLSSFVWTIEVTGNRRVPTKDILSVASGAGLNRGVPKWRLDCPAVERTLKTKLPTISWAGVYVKGTRVTIEVVEKTLPEEKNQSPAHITAIKAGLIKEVLVFSGHAAVKEGDTVVPGQILISGIIPPPEEPRPEQLPATETQREQSVPRRPTYVHAAGIVRARVWYEGYGEAPLVENGERFTGRQVTRVCMKIKGREIILAGPQKIPFLHYQTETSVKKPPPWRNLQLPVELVISKYREVENYRLVRDRAEARRLAGERALHAVQKQLPQGARIVHKQLDELVVKEPESLVRVKAFVESLEEIGTEQPFTPGEESQNQAPAPSSQP